jgi:hypothetical protein
MQHQILDHWRRQELAASALGAAGLMPRPVS